MHYICKPKRSVLFLGGGSGGSVSKYKAFGDGIVLFLPCVVERRNLSGEAVVGGLCVDQPVLQVSGALLLALAHNLQIAVLLAAQNQLLLSPDKFTAEVLHWGKKPEWI